MSYRKRMVPGAMVLMVGLLPLAASQGHAQSSSVTSMLSSTVTVLPSDSTITDIDSNYDQLGDFTLPETDLLGTQEVLSLPHARSGNSSGWLIGGALGAAAGIAGLASSGGSSAASLLRTPATTPGPVFSTEPGSIAAGSGDAVSGSGGNSIINIGSSSTGAIGGNIGSGGIIALSEPSSGGSGVGDITPQGAITPEPGALVMFGCMGLMFTAVKLRRRKR